jgi:hypothetical protein
MRKALLMLPLLFAPVAFAVNGPVERWAKAAGGRDKIAAIKAVYREATLEYGGYQGTLKVWHSAHLPVARTSAWLGCSVSTRGRCLFIRKAATMWAKPTTAMKTERKDMQPSPLARKVFCWGSVRSILTCKA